MKRFLLFSNLIIALFLLTSCSQLMSSRTEIDRIFNTRIIAIDKIDEAKVLYTLTTKTGVSKSQAQVGSSQTSEVLVTEGATVFDAAKKMLKYSHKKPHYGHTEFIIFGEETARAGILPYLDFISRNQELRYNAKIYIVKGMTANSFISKLNIGNMYLADKISMLEDNAYALSLASKVTLGEALYIFDKENVSTFLPFLLISPPKAGEVTALDDYDLVLDGYAIFEADKLKAFLDSDLSRGVNWIKNRIISGVILVEAPDKKKVSLEIIGSKTSIKPYVDENGLQCTIGVKFNTNIGETLSTEDISIEETLDYLKQQQEKQVKKEIEAILQYAIDNNMDIFGLAANFSIKYPMMKNELRENWKELFPEIKFHLEVDSNINRTYLTKQPQGIK